MFLVCKYIVKKYKSIKKLPYIIITHEIYNLSIKLDSNCDYELMMSLSCYDTIRSSI